MSFSTKSTTTPLPNDEVFNQTSIWVPVITVIVLSFIFMFIVVFSQKIYERCSKLCNNDEVNNMIETSINYESNNLGMPSTPPPSYSAIERQLSYVSQMSLNLSQIEYPPDYSDLGTIDSKKKTFRSTSSSTLTNHSIPEMQRNKIFSRPSLNTFIVRTFMRQSSQQTNFPEQKGEVQFMITSGSKNQLLLPDDTQNNATSCSEQNSSQIDNTLGNIEIDEIENRTASSVNLDYCKLNIDGISGDQILTENCKNEQFVTINMESTKIPIEESCSSKVNDNNDRSDNNTLLKGSNNIIYNQIMLDKNFVDANCNITGVNVINSNQNSFDVFKILSPLSNCDTVSNIDTNENTNDRLSLTNMNLITESNTFSNDFLENTVSDVISNETQLGNNKIEFAVENSGFLKDE